MKKTLFLLMIIFTVFLVSCQDKIKINIDASITVYKNEPYQLEFKTNDKKGLLFESVDEALFTVDENGIITPLVKGQGFLRITSKSDKNVTAFITVNVLEGDFITVVEELFLLVGETKQLDVETSVLEGLNYSSSDVTILTVSNTGFITAISVGAVTVTITSKANENVKATINITVTEGSLIEVEKNITLTRNETKKLNVNTNVSLGVSYVSLNENIVTVSSDGTLTGVNKGIAIVKVVSNSNQEKYEEVTVTVEQLSNLVKEARIDPSTTFQIDDLITNAKYTSSDENIATVNEQGLINAISPGLVTITVVNKNDNNIYEEFTLYVTTEPTSIRISGQEEMLLGGTQKLDLIVEPIYGSKIAIYQSLNPSVLTVDSNGNVTTLNTGSAAVRVTSLSNPELTQTIYITVKSVIVVDANKTLGDTVDYLGYTFEYGVTLFDKISDAVSKAVNNTEIVVFAGTYNSDLVIDKKINLITNEKATINGNIVIASSNVSINGFIVSNGNISNTTNIKDVQVLNNEFVNSNSSHVIKLENVTEVNVSNNLIMANNDIAILVTGLKEGKNYINENIIKGGNIGIKVYSNENYKLDTIIDLMWNKINGAETALDINLGYGNNIDKIRQVVRFNEIENYLVALSTNSDHNLDLNLNYWGTNNPDLSKFINVKIAELSAFYKNDEVIISKDNYNPRVPVKIEITNKIDEIEVGEEFTIEYNIYPKELGDSTVRWLYSNLPALEVDGAKIIGVFSWDVLITLRARDDSTVFDSFMLSITTDPQLDFVPENATYSDFYVGNTFNLNVNVLPYQIRDEGVAFSSSDESIATVNEAGIVSLLSEGVVTISAHLHIDETIKQDFTFRVFAEIDINDPFGFAISTMVNYVTFKSWNVYGVDFDYQAEFLDSVSRILIEDITIDTSLMLPLTSEYSDFRPGNSVAPRLKPNLPENQIYNDAYVQYVVVHETANTNEGGGARWHAEYLYGIPDRIASWHFTVDDKEIYQHIPTDEVAFHAADGRTVAGSPWADGNTGGIGGGNRNGIGIETSVALGDDIMSVWHRVARLAAKLSKEYNLPGNQHRTNVKFHQDFSGKICPQSMIRGGYVDFFYSLVEQEYIREYNFEGLTLSINSHNLEYLNNLGRVIKRPLTAMTVSYDLTISYGGVTKTETLYVYIPGELK